ncbi:hypothetical protein L873DRAFT_1149333 [Choiromyces venosus 120613-1]|uniref:Uncharacterized protein n=1 Tax=Choiromyces venosus 120613-1 TaxID=1336337 RepID=A0A3N4JFS6_9PEZI|nr:hypothetical protein L873DRAFT_1149333 [Choiromyces venosus 120613-1]
MGQEGRQRRGDYPSWRRPRSAVRSSVGNPLRGGLFLPAPAGRQASPPPKCPAARCSGVRPMHGSLELTSRCPARSSVFSTEDGWCTTAWCSINPPQTKLWMPRLSSILANSASPRAAAENRAAVPRRSQRRVKICAVSVSRSKTDRRRFVRCREEGSDGFRVCAPMCNRSSFGRERRGIVFVFVLCCVALVVVRGDGVEREEERGVRHLVRYCDMIGSDNEVAHAWCMHAWRGWESPVWNFSE